MVKDFERQWRDAVSRRPIDDAGTSGRRHRCQCDQYLDILNQDVRYALRSLARTPGFTATAIVVAGLGIGATTATFSTADHVLLRPLPFADPERLVRLSEDHTPLGYPRHRAVAAQLQRLEADANVIREHRSV